MARKKKGFALYSHGESYKPGQVWIKGTKNLVPRLLRHGGFMPLPKAQRGIGLEGSRLITPRVKDVKSLMAHRDMAKEAGRTKEFAIGLNTPYNDPSLLSGEFENPLNPGFKVQTLPFGETYKKPSYMSKLLPLGGREGEVTPQKWLKGWTEWDNPYMNEYAVFGYKGTPNKGVYTTEMLAPLYAEPHKMHLQYKLVDGKPVPISKEELESIERSDSSIEDITDTFEYKKGGKLPIAQDGITPVDYTVTDAPVSFYPSENMFEGLTPEEQMEKFGITEDQFNVGYLTRMGRDRAKRTVYPFGYDEHDTFFKRASHVLWGKPEEKLETKFYPGLEAGHPDVQTRSDYWNMYLGYPQEFGTLSVSKYAPSISKDKDALYYSDKVVDQLYKDLYSNIAPDDIEDLKARKPASYWIGKAEDLNKEYDKMFKQVYYKERGDFTDPRLLSMKNRIHMMESIADLMESKSKGKPHIVKEVKSAREHDMRTDLGDYTEGIGFDNGRPYVSYYDKWNLAGPGSIVGKPFEVYNRIYLDDIIEGKTPEKSLESLSDTAPLRFERGGRVNGTVGYPKMQPGGPTIDAPYVHDFNFTPTDREYLNILNREKYCPGGECLEQAYKAWDVMHSSKEGIPDQWKMKKQLGLESMTADQFAALSPESQSQLASTHAYWYPPENDYSASSWDIHGLLQDKGGQALFTAKDVSDWGTMDELEKDELMSKIPVGSIIGYGGVKEGWQAEKGYNVKHERMANRHSAIVVGYDERGVPVVYNWGKYAPMDEESFMSDMVTNITTTPQTQHMTKEWLEQEKMFDTSPKFADYSYDESIKGVSKMYKQLTPDDKEMAPFMKALEDNKFELMNELRLNNTEYDRLARDSRTNST
jgi:hypothetical protein